MSKYKDLNLDFQKAVILIGNNVPIYKRNFEVFYENITECSRITEFEDINLVADLIVITDFFEFEGNDFRFVLNNIKKLLSDNGEIIVFCRNYYNLIDARRWGKESVFTISEVKKILCELNVGKISCWYPFPNGKNPVYVISESELKEFQVEDIAGYYSKFGILPQNIVEELFEQENYTAITDMVFLHTSRWEDEFRYLDMQKLVWEKGFQIATAFFDKKAVIKFSISKDSTIRIKELYRNNKKLLNRKIDTIPYEHIREGVLIMPFVNYDTVESRLLKYMAVNDVRNIKKILEEFWELINKSSDIKTDYPNEVFRTDKNRTKVLTDAYIDMTFDNCFYDDGRYVFFDQEYCVKNVPPEVIMSYSIAKLFSRNGQINLSYKEKDLAELLQFNYVENCIDGIVKLAQGDYRIRASVEQAIVNEIFFRQSVYYTFNAFKPNIDKILYLLREKGIYSVAIYGFGRVGRNIFWLMYENGIDIPFVIDINAHRIRSEDCPVPVYEFFPNDRKNEIDMVLVCMVIGSEEIVKAHSASGVKWMKLGDFL